MIGRPHILGRTGPGVQAQNATPDASFMPSSPLAFRDPSVHLRIHPKSTADDDGPPPILLTSAVIFLCICTLREAHPALVCKSPP